MSLLRVTLADGRVVECPPGTEVGSLADPSAAPKDLPYLGALVNNDVSSLSYPLSVNCAVRFLSADDSHGWRIYRRSLSFLLAKAVRELCPGASFSVDHSLGPGLYCSFSAQGGNGACIAAEELAALEAHMRRDVARDVPIERRKIAFSEAIRLFRESGQTEKLYLLRYRNPPRVVLHWCEGFTDLAHGPLAPRTGVLRHFRLVRYAPGFVLHLPERSDPTRVPPFEDQPHLLQIFQEHKEWGRILGVNTAGRLNEAIAEGRIEDFIMTAEALHEKKLARIADDIAGRRERVRFILVAGPSSAGKTTFSKRLSTQLRVNGLRPVTISTDDYFVGESRNPVDEHGQPDYEHLEAVDLELFNRHLVELLEGREVALPRFEFASKSRGEGARRLRIGPETIVIVEGIHGLNPELARMAPEESKFRIYVSALTQLSVDANNRISTTDNRLMRRIVRDHKYRRYSALDTLRRWPSVRRGEKRWIFPYQRFADATFNSALDYELAVLKPFVEPLLMEVKPDQPEYAEARRLTEFLLNFLTTSDRPVPHTSILREYIGGSMFRY
ncbi:MAG: nucleoside kinase [Lentisphaerae bacterium]|nr:nucleoside kinase [Lentisphaerota bacterium]